MKTIVVGSFIDFTDAGTEWIKELVRAGAPEGPAQGPPNAPAKKEFFMCTHTRSRIHHTHVRKRANAHTQARAHT